MRTHKTSDFTNVDQTADPGSYLRYLDTFSAMETVRAYKQHTYALLDLREGARILEVGCGTGEDARALAQQVGATGRVVGVDRSETMIAEAQKRSHGCDLPVEFRRGDAHCLEFEAGTFDGARSERTFQHLEDPGQALGELIRVLRPGGRVVIGEPDWDTLIVDVPDRAVTRRIVNFACDSYRNGWVGRQLPGLFQAHGLAEIGVVPMTMVLTDLALAGQIWSLGSVAEQARASGVVSAGEATEWLGHLEAASRAGRFFAALTGFLVRGRKS